MLTKDFLSGRKLEGEELLGLVASLYTSYPLLQQEYMSVFEALLKVAAKYHEFDPESFVDCARYVTGFLFTDIAYNLE